jgi:hypothetical protein
MKYFLNEDFIYRYERSCMCSKYIRNNTFSIDRITISKKAVYAQMGKYVKHIYKELDNED